MRRERRVEAKERLTEEGLPPSAAELLHYDSDASFEESFTAMKDLLGERLQQAVEGMFREGGRSPARSTDCVPKADPLKEAFSPKE